MRTERVAARTPLRPHPPFDVLPEGRTAQSWYDELVRRKVFLCAARIAKAHNLGRLAVLRAVRFQVFRWLNLGLRDAAASLVEQYGLDPSNLRFR